MRLFFSLAFATFLSTCGRAQVAPEPWTDADAAEYARRANDSTTWDLDLFATDLEWAADLTAYPVGITGFASPVPAYDWGYVSSAPLSLSLPGKRIVGHRLSCAYDEYRPRPTADTSLFYGTTCNVFVLTDSLELEEGNAVIVSRNAPHYLATGQVPTSHGPVEWVHMNLADGASFLLVAQRYFDLRQGRTILIAPRKDGSLRFRQIKDSPGGIPSAKDGWEPIEAIDRAFQTRLQNTPEVRSFFLARGNV